MTFVKLSATCILVLAFKLGVCLGDSTRSIFLGVDPLKTAASEAVQALTSQRSRAEFRDEPTFRSTPGKSFISSDTFSFPSPRSAGAVSSLLEMQSKTISSLHEKSLAHLRKALSAEHLIDNDIKLNGTTPSLLESQRIALQLAASPGKKCNGKKIEDAAMDIVMEAMKSMMQCFKKKGCPEVTMLAPDPCKMEECSKIIKEGKCKGDCRWIPEMGCQISPPKMPKGCPIKAMTLKENMCKELNGDEDECKKADDCEVIKSEKLLSGCDELSGLEDETSLASFLQDETICSLNTKKEMENGMALLGQLDPEKGALWTKLSEQEGKCSKATKETDCVDACSWFAKHPKGMQCGLNGDWCKKQGLDDSLAAALDEYKNGMVLCDAEKNADSCESKSKKGCHWSKGKCSFTVPQAITDEMISAFTGAFEKCGEVGKYVAQMMQKGGECASAIGKAECEKKKFCKYKEKTKYKCGTLKSDSDCPDKCKEVKEDSCEVDEILALCPNLKMDQEQLTLQCTKQAEKEIEEYCKSGKRSDYCGGGGDDDKSGTKPSTVAAPLLILTVLGNAI